MSCAIHSASLTSVFQAALELRIANFCQAALLRDFIQIGYALGLDVAVVHQPVLAFKSRRVIGVQRLVAVEEGFWAGSEQIGPCKIN